MWLHLCLGWFCGYFSFAELLSCPLELREGRGARVLPAGMGHKKASMAWSPTGPPSASAPHKLPSSPLRKQPWAPSLFLRKPALGTESWRLPPIFKLQSNFHFHLGTEASTLPAGR